MSNGTENVPMYYAPKIQCFDSESSLRHPAHGANALRLSCCDRGCQIWSVNSVQLRFQWYNSYHGFSQFIGHIGRKEYLEAVKSDQKDLSIICSLPMVHFGTGKELYPIHNVVNTIPFHQSCYIRKIFENILFT